MKEIDVLCVGAATYDLIFSVSHHPLSDEKMTAASFECCGGGPAANAAVAVSRLGCKAALAGYLGNDWAGNAHFKELQQENVLTDVVVRGGKPTPISSIYVKPNGDRSLVNYREATWYLNSEDIDSLAFRPKVMLFDGHEPDVALPLIKYAKKNNIKTMLDAGSVHCGTKVLVNQVDYLVCSEKFAFDFTCVNHEELAAIELLGYAKRVVITLGEKGLIWRTNKTGGRLSSYAVDAIDTTGAGDAFHGAFAVCLALEKTWDYTLRYSSAVGALSCTKLGARIAIPKGEEVRKFLNGINEIA